MKANAQIVGKVEFRTGDGPMLVIPEGPVEVQTGPRDATLSWHDDDANGAATLTLGEYQHYVAQGAIRLDG